MTRQQLQIRRSAIMNPAGVPVPATCTPTSFYLGMPMMPPQPAPPFRVPVVDVWADDIDEKQCDVGYFVAHARCIAVDVQCPGFVHRADKDPSKLTAEQRYAIIKANVDALEPLQVGLAICTEEGQITAWEFNLSDFFDGEAVHRHANHPASHLKRHGVPVAKLMRVLRLICRLRPGVSLATHAGAYHVAYLIKIINGGSQLPRDMAGFLNEVRRCLGDDVYDVARMTADHKDLPVGLERIAGRLGLARPLSVHQLSGANSALALQVFIELVYHPYRRHVTRSRGVLQGLQTV